MLRRYEERAAVAACEGLLKGGLAKKRNPDWTAAYEKVRRECAIESANLLPVRAVTVRLVARERMEHLFNEMMGSEIAGGGAYRTASGIPEERQDELAREFVDSREHVNPRPLWMRALSVYAGMLMWPVNMIISEINLMLPAGYEIPKIRVKVPPGWHQLAMEADRRKAAQAYALLESGKMSSRRAEYLLSTAVTNPEDAKGLLIGRKVGNEMAQVELAEKLTEPRDAREVLSCAPFPDSVAAILTRNARLPKALP